MGKHSTSASSLSFVSFVCSSGTASHQGWDKNESQFSDLRVRATAVVGLTPKHSIPLRGPGALEHQGVCGNCVVSCRHQ